MEELPKVFDTYCVDLYLPAYSNAEVSGYLFLFKLNFTSNRINTFEAEDELGNSLLRELDRVLHILYRINKVWQMLQGSFILEGHYSQFKAGATASAGLGIAIALFNLARMINGSRIVSNVIGTGFVRASGHIEKIAGLSSKSRVILNQLGVTHHILTATTIPHLNYLDSILLEYC